MEAPKTRYARSADGTYIAFQVFGNGPDLLVTSAWISHLELAWHDPDLSSWLSELGTFARVISLDQRGIATPCSGQRGHGEGSLRPTMAHIGQKPKKPVRTATAPVPAIR